MSLPIGSDFALSGRLSNKCSGRFSFRAGRRPGGLPKGPSGPSEAKVSATCQECVACSQALSCELLYQRRFMKYSVSGCPITLCTSLPVASACS